MSSRSIRIRACWFDELTCRLWRQYVQGLIDTNKYLPGADVLLLDGIPRSPAQAETLDEHIQVLAVIHLVCDDEEELVQRMKRRAEIQNRPDDADESVIRRRFEVFHAETAKVLAHYDPSLVHRVTATGAPSRILLNILEESVPVWSHFVIRWPDPRRSGHCPTPRLRSRVDCRGSLTIGAIGFDRAGKACRCMSWSIRAT